LPSVSLRGRLGTAAAEVELDLAGEASMVVDLVAVGISEEAAVSVAVSAELRTSQAGRRTSEAEGNHS